MPISTLDRLASSLGPASVTLTRQAEMISRAIERRTTRNARDYESGVQAVTGLWQPITGALHESSRSGRLMESWLAYTKDFAERGVLAMDVLRQRADIFLEHDAAGSPPVLIYDYDIVVDGAHLPRPSNYLLLRIRPRDADRCLDWKRPYVIIDPRAGHGPGIGGFKPDSQVGVALADGHPVYFVAFRPRPVPGQTLADVTHAEAAFLRELQRLHPDAPKPIVVGNCQGGWATALLAATNPDLAGPIVLNGAPMSYWAGRLGQDPMRYSGGLLGGVLPAMIVSDLGAGVFDGAHLVLNFEKPESGAHLVSTIL